MTRLTSNNIKANVYKPQIIKEMSGDVRKYHKILLEYGGFKNITDAKKQTGNNAKEIYSYLFEQLNEFIIESNKQENQKHITSINEYKKNETKITKEIKKTIKQKKEIVAKEKEDINNLKMNFNHLSSLASPITKRNRDARINKIDNSNLTLYLKEDKIRERFDRQALGGAFKEIQIKNNDKDNFYDGIDNVVLNEFYKKDPKQVLLCNIIIEYVMRKQINSEEFTDKTMFYHSQFEENLKSPSQIMEWLNTEKESFFKWIDDIIQGSDLIFYNVSKVTIQTAKRNKTRAGSYIELPKHINDKKACVNIKNLDDKCVLYCLKAHKHYDEITCRKNEPNSYKKFNDVIIPDEITYPIDVLKDIPKIARANNIKINVFNYDKDYKNLEVLYNDKSKNTNICDLLLVSNENINHFVLIRDISKLLRINDDHEKRFWCRQCLNSSYSCIEDLNKHIEVCNKNESVRCILPKEEDNKLKFKNFGNSFQHPFSVFLDFESTLEKVDDNNNEDKSTVKYQKHTPNSCGMKYNCIHDEYSEERIIFNCDNEEDLLEKTILKLEEYAIKSYELLQQNKSTENIIFKSNEEKKLAKSKTTCSECNNSFTEKNKMVIHHDHISGEYISTLCNDCNLKYKYKKFLPVYIHNLKGYDSHFLVPYLSRFGYSENDSVSCIPNNEEKYISFSKKICIKETIKEGRQASEKQQWHINKQTAMGKQFEKFLNKEDKIIKEMFEIRFLDTLAFLPSSIEKLTENLKSGSSDINKLRKVFKNTSKHFKNDEEFILMTEKGIYPYEYITKYDVLNETKLPDINSFYSQLVNKGCDEKDYQKALNVWKTFKCKTIMDYHNLYLTTDVLLLADIWENFREVCYKIYKLDVTYYYTSPGLSWDAFLKHTSQEYKEEKKDFYIELLTDMDMYLLFEKSIRGGLSQISKRYAKANHKELSTYNPNAIDEYILYLDANNLYGSGMSSYLPEKDFKWNTEEWTNEKILSIPDDNDVGYLFEVDLHYPQELHDLHNGYALASENIEIKNSMLNQFQQENRKDSKIKKLTTSFYDKIEYGVNYRLLKLFIKQGLQITKFHRVVQYSQSPYMRSYINKNTEERKHAKNDFEKDFYKLMNNSVYGKTMENVRNRINFRLLTTEEQALSIRNTRKKFTIFNENLVGVHLLKKEVKLNKPIFIGQNVLDESKVVMYDFHYNFMLKKFEKRNLDLLFTDTDSLCYHIKRQNPYEIIAQNKKLFDLSAYPKEHYLYDASNKKVIGKMKNETVDGEVHYITEFIGLRSKLYAYKTEDDDEHKKCKGVKRNVVASDIKFQDYKNTLFQRQKFNIKQNVFRSHKHQVFSENISKIGLSYNDDKSYILDNNINCYTFGHYKIK